MKIKTQKQIVRIAFNLNTYRNHKSLIEKIRKKALELEKKEWTIQLTWIKAHVGHHGNEIAKEATKNKETIYKKYLKVK